MYIKYSINNEYVRSYAIHRMSWIDSKPAKVELTVDTTFKELKNFLAADEGMEKWLDRFLREDKFNQIRDHRHSLEDYLLENTTLYARYVNQ
jgi:hypothetical protein